MSWGKLLKPIFNPTLQILILTVIFFVSFARVLEYNIRCLIPPCGVAMRSILTHITKNINIEGVNYFNVILGLIVSYLISSLLIFSAKKLIKKFKS